MSPRRDDRVEKADHKGQVKSGFGFVLANRLYSEEYIHESQRAMYN